MSVTKVISSSEFASQINLSLDAMKSRLAITNGQTNISDTAIQHPVNTRRATP